MMMDQIAALISAPNVYAYPAEAVTVPCAIVAYPSEIEYDLTFGSDSVRLVFPIFYVVGGSGDEARDAISAVLVEAPSIKASLDGAHAFGDVRVTDAQIEDVSIAGVTYLATRFDAEVLV